MKLLLLFLAILPAAGADIPAANGELLRRAAKSVERLLG